MPTGYTAAIKDGITFEQYAMSCARAFGALMSMRDDPFDAPIPEAFEPSRHCADRISAATAELARLRALPYEQCIDERDAAFQREQESHERRRAERIELRAKYEAMLAQAVAWQAPTPEHVKYKEFMESQISSSLDWDCNDGYDKPPVRKSLDGWLATSIAAAERDVSYYTAQSAKEIEGAAGRTAWVKALRESLKPALGKSADGPETAVLVAVVGGVE